MRTTQMRLRLVQERVRKRLAQRRNRQILTLAVFCSVLMLQEISLISQLQPSGQMHTLETQMAGATFLLSHAGGYVLVAIISFVVAVVFTLLCLRHRKK